MNGLDFRKCNFFIQNTKFFFTVLLLLQSLMAGVRFFDFSSAKEIHRIADPYAYHLSSLFDYVLQDPSLKSFF